MPSRLCLVVDDEPAVRGIVGAVLDGEFQVLGAENAAQAMSIIENLAGGLDLVITDIVMPGEMNGTDLARSIRQAYPGIPVILTSGYADQQVVQGLPVSFGFLPKPFARQTLLDAVSEVMGRKRAAGAQGRVE